MAAKLPKRPKKRKTVQKTEKILVGWREWVGLPELGVARIKAKIDTGARTAALHAWDISPFHRRSQDWVRFTLHPLQRNNRRVIHCEAPLIGRRRVRNSGGGIEERYVIESQLVMNGRSWPIEITLTNRDEMGFRMLLGRRSLRGKVVIDPARSFLTGKF